MTTKRKTTTPKKTTKQTAPALDPETMPDDELETEFKSIYGEMKRRAEAAADAKQKRVDELYAELESLGVEFKDEADDGNDEYGMPRRTEGPKPPRAYDLRDGTFRPIGPDETDLESYPQEWADRRAWAVLGGLIADGVLAVPDLDLMSDEDREKMLLHLQYVVLSISGVFLGNHW